LPNATHEAANTGELVDEIPPAGYHFMPDGSLMRDSEHDNEAAAGDPCWENYVQIGMKEKGGKQVPNCVPATSTSMLEAEEYALSAKTPAPQKDKIKGSSKNKKDSASGGKKSKEITFSKAVEKAISNKVKEHNKKAPKGRQATLGMLKAVYRRGAGAFSSSHRPGQTRGSWAMARINAYLRLLSSGKPSRAAYTQDNDLLPSSHPRASKKKADASIELSVTARPEAEYTSTQDKILAMTELSGLGYEAEFAFSASWLRAVRNGDDPFKRISMLATMTYDSLDADLLPTKRDEA
jgi:hypothetical protein